MANCSLGHSFVFIDWLRSYIFYYFENIAAIYYWRFIWWKYQNPINPTLLALKERYRSNFLCISINIICNSTFIDVTGDVNLEIHVRSRFHRQLYPDGLSHLRIFHKQASSDRHFSLVAESRPIHFKMGQHYWSDPLHYLSLHVPVNAAPVLQGAITEEWK